MERLSAEALQGDVLVWDLRQTHTFFSFKPILIDYCPGKKDRKALYEKPTQVSNDEVESDALRMISRVSELKVRRQMSDGYFTKPSSIVHHFPKVGGSQ